MYNLKTFSDPFISLAIALIFTTLSWPRIFVMVFTALSRGLVARNTAFNKLRSTSILNSVSKAKVSDRGLGFPLQRAKQKSRHRKIGLIFFGNVFTLRWLSNEWQRTVHKFTIYQISKNPRDFGSPILSFEIRSLGM